MARVPVELVYGEQGRQAAGVIGGTCGLALGYVAGSFLCSVLGAGG
jgi:hypothetical protein